MSVPSHPSEEDLIAYSGGALPAARTKMIESHLAACATCRSEVAAWHSLRWRTASYFQEQVARTPLPADAWSPLQAAIERPAWRDPWTAYLLGHPLATLVLAAVLIVGVGMGLNRLVAYQTAVIPFIATVLPAPEPSPLPPTIVPTSTMQATPRATEMTIPTVATEVPSGDALVPSQAGSPVPPELPISTIAPEMLPPTATPLVVATVPMLPSATLVPVPTLPPPTLIPTVTVEPTLPGDVPTSTPDTENGNGNGNNGNGGGNGNGNGNGNNGNGNGNGGGNGNGNNGNGNEGG